MLEVFDRGQELVYIDKRFKSEMDDLKNQNITSSVY